MFVSGGEEDGEGVGCGGMWRGLEGISCGWVGGCLGGGVRGGGCVCEIFGKQM